MINMIVSTLFLIVAIFCAAFSFRLKKSTKDDSFQNALSGKAKIYNAEFTGSAVYYVEFSDQQGKLWKVRAQSLNKNGSHFKIGQIVPIKYYYLKHGTSVVVKIVHPDAEENAINLSDIVGVFAIIFLVISLVVMFLI